MIDLEHRIGRASAVYAAHVGQDLDRVVGERADGSRGSRLGLRPVLASVERAGGRLEEVSTQDAGSRFTLACPPPGLAS